MGTKSLTQNGWAMHTPLQVADTPFDFVAPTSLMARAAGLWGYLPANGAAFLLQVMHPTIGDVVGKYSVYRTDPFGRAIRSIDSVNLWVYGEIEAVEEGNRLRRLHQPLQMVNGDGARISALNPQPYGWVLATGYATTVWLWPYMFGRSLTVDEQDQLFADSRRVARLLQVPPGHFPSSRAEFWTYFDDMVSTNLVNHPVAQEILGSQLSGAGGPPPGLPRLLSPLWPPVGRSVGRALYLLIGSLLPVAVRETLQMRWGALDAVAAEALWASMRVGTKVLPDRLTYTPIAYHSLRRAQAIEDIKRRAATSFV